MEDYKVGWNFPSNNYGQVVGISDAGIETFNGALISSLTREVCQNSLDAIKDFDKPVVIEFKNVRVKKQEIPGYDSLLDSLKRCYTFWKQLNNEKTYKFFEKAIRCMNDSEISILRISDYNTTGLTGSDEEFNTPWQNLVKANGVSDKNETSGGSFGIGKAAPFACSVARTVFYRTLDENGVRAVQGISRLVSYKNLLNETTAGIGYYGNTNKNTAIHKLQKLDNINERNKSGTDLFVIGFNYSEDWKSKMISELLDGFMLSFLNGKLEVKIGECHINNENLGTVIEKYKSIAKYANDYYKVMTAESAKEFKEDFNGMGTLNLRVLLEKDLNRNVLISRNNGMKLFDKNRISSTIQFSSVLSMEGKELNAFFRKMESPQHNAWEFDRHPEPKKAKKIRTELYKWIKDKILELGKYDSGDELDVEGIGELIPDFFDFDNSDKGNAKEEDISDATKNWEVKVSEKPLSLKNISKGLEIEGKDIEESFGELDEEDEYDLKDVSNGSMNLTDGGDVSLSKAKDGDGNRPIEKYNEITTYRMRMFVSDSNQSEYTLSFVADCNISIGYLEVRIAGEQSNIKAKISEAHSVSGMQKQLQCNNNRIYLNNIQKSVRNRVTFKLEDDELYSLEVKVYASAI